MLQGWLTSIPMRGTFISDVLPDSVPMDILIRIAKVERNLLTSDYAAVDDFGDIPMVTGTGDSLNFDDGCPDTRLLPAVVLARAYHGRSWATGSGLASRWRSEPRVSSTQSFSSRPWGLAGGFRMRDRQLYFDYPQNLQPCIRVFPLVRRWVHVWAVQ